MIIGGWFYEIGYWEIDNYDASITVLRLVLGAIFVSFLSTRCGHQMRTGIGNDTGRNGCDIQEKFLFNKTTIQVMLRKVD